MKVLRKDLGTKDSKPWTWLALPSLGVSNDVLSPRGPKQDHTGTRTLSKGAFLMVAMLGTTGKKGGSRGWDFRSWGLQVWGRQWGRSSEGLFSTGSSHKQKGVAARQNLPLTQPRFSPVLPSQDLLPSQDRLRLRGGRPGAASPSPVVPRSGFFPSPAEGRRQELAPFHDRGGQS